MNLVLHLRSRCIDGQYAATQESKAAAKALLDAHMELRQGFRMCWCSRMWPGREPLVTEQTISSIP